MTTRAISQRIAATTKTAMMAVTIFGRILALMFLMAEVIWAAPRSILDTKEPDWVLL